MLAALRTIYPFIAHLQVSRESHELSSFTPFAGKKLSCPVGMILSHLQGMQGIRLLVIDNIAAYHWLDYPVKTQPMEQGQASSDLTLQVSQPGRWLEKKVSNTLRLYVATRMGKCLEEKGDEALSVLEVQAIHAAAASILKGLAKQLKLAVLVSKHCFKSLTYGEHSSLYEEVGYCSTNCFTF